MNTESRNTLEALFSRMTPQQQLCFKQAVVQQTIYYVSQRLPSEVNDEGERSFISVAQRWLDQPTRENAKYADISATLDMMDGGVRYFDYSDYYLAPAWAAGARDGLEATNSALRAAGDDADIARQWQVAAAEAILQGQSLPQFEKK